MSELLSHHNECLKLFTLVEFQRWGHKFSSFVLKITGDLSILPLEMGATLGTTKNVFRVE